VPSTVPPDGDARRLVVERDLVRRAFEHLTVDAFMTLPFEALGPTKALLKRYFSAGPWAPEDHDALAAAVGPGEGWWRRPLDDDVVLEYGWDDGRFSIGFATTVSAGVAGEDTPDNQLAATFDGTVVPEATPNPRTIRFRTGRIHEGPSRWYDSATKAAGDPGASRLFAEFEEVANVLVGPDFVAVSLRRATDWERLLAAVLSVVTEEFAGGGTVTTAPVEAGRHEGEVGRGGGRRAGRLERAWPELGALRPARPDDLRLVVDAARGPDPFRRQVAANLLGEADEGAAAQEWAHLVGDPSRAVRRVTVDAMVDAGREGLRPLLETALADADPWVRWKAIRGLVELGPEPSRDAIAACSEDPDFRVRLEVAAALRAGTAGKGGDGAPESQP
jgi:hypothetical protein